MVLGKPERLTNLDNNKDGLTAYVKGPGGGCLDVFTLVRHFSFSHWETTRYRLKY